MFEQINKTSKRLRTSNRIFTWNNQEPIFLFMKKKLLILFKLSVYSQRKSRLTEYFFKMWYDDLVVFLPFSLVLFLGIAHTKSQTAKVGTGDGLWWRQNMRRAHRTCVRRLRRIGIWVRGPKG